MKKVLLAAAAVIAMAPAAHAQDKYGRTFEPQPQASAPATTTTTTTVATTPTPTYTSNDTGSMTTGGPYIGAYGGYAWANADTAAGNADVNGEDYGGMIGYKVNNVMNNTMGISTAVEAYLGGSTADDTVGGVDVKKNREWGVNVRPGIQMSNGFNPYAILGYRRTNFEVAGDENGYNGFDAGVGAELVSWGNMGLRADYTHTWYNSNNGIDPDENDVRVGLTYHFQ
jgi:opacity protein-like surface antigen